MPGIFTKSMNHFATGGTLTDEDVVKPDLEDGRYTGYTEQVMKGSGALAPPEEDPGDVVRATVDVVNAPFGKRPFRDHFEPSDDGSEMVNAVVDRGRREFMGNLGVGDFLVPVRHSASHSKPSL